MTKIMGSLQSVAGQINEVPMRPPQKYARPIFSIFHNDSRDEKHLYNLLLSL